MAPLHATAKERREQAQHATCEAARAAPEATGHRRKPAS
jgi:hypothetical protein